MLAVPGLEQLSRKPRAPLGLLRLLATHKAQLLKECRTVSATQYMLSNNFLNESNALCMVGYSILPPLLYDGDLNGFVISGLSIQKSQNH